MKTNKNIFLLVVMYGASTLTLLTSVMSCSKDKHQHLPQSQLLSRLDKVQITLVNTKERHFSESILEIKGEGFSKVKANNIVTVCGITGTVQSVLGDLKLDVSVPNPDHKTISGSVYVTVNGKMGKYGGQYVIRPLYNKHDIEQLKAFLESKSRGRRNIEILNDRFHKNIPQWAHYKQYEDPKNWLECSGARFQRKSVIEEDYDRRLRELVIPYRAGEGDPYIEGELKLVNCSMLYYVNVNHEALTSIDLRGENPNLTIKCDRNNLTSLTVSHPLSFQIPPPGATYLRSEINPQKRGDLTSTDGLHYTLVKL